MGWCIFEIICTSKNEIALTCIEVSIVHDVLWVAGMFFWLPLWMVAGVSDSDPLVCVCMISVIPTFVSSCSPFNVFRRGRIFFPHLKVQNAKTTNDQDKIEILQELGSDVVAVNREMHSAFNIRAVKFGLPAVLFVLQVMYFLFQNDFESIGIFDKLEKLEDIGIFAVIEFVFFYLYRAGFDLLPCMCGAKAVPRRDPGRALPPWRRQRYLPSVGEHVPAVQAAAPLVAHAMADNP